MEPLVIAAVSALISISVALVGAYVAKRKGLPSINAEIEQRNRELIDLLQAQLTALRSDHAASQADFNDCRAKLTQALDENQSLMRRVTLAEGDLLTLYRETGKIPPQRLRGARGRPND